MDGLHAPCSATERLRAPAVSVKAGTDSEITRLGLDPGSEEDGDEEGEWESEEGAKAAVAALSRGNARRCVPQRLASLSANPWRELGFARGLGGGRRT